ncbi:M48 family metalloprotease [Ramlibacter pallidus]|uniref:M48 family metalloprotease n=1 Tax=Ramlibacter pallidus TaxID=2780087 RepID=A0ABR9S7X2_9BURK|nr:M48 family metalloprotease [Ramlibacter pallidus]MBE7369524.1 M48 family metalloprotease [Ramlibacter pallidus]
MRFFELQQQARARTTRLVLLFALAVAGTALGVHLALALCWWTLNWFLGPVEIGFPRSFFAVNVGVTLLLVLGGWWIETSNLKMAGGAERLARRIGAREARPGTSMGEQRLCNIVDEVCIAAHMPRPTVMVMPRHDAINAFATGWDEDDAVVAVTQGALDLLTREELQGIVAHECSHIHEGDTRLNMQLAGMVFGLEMVWDFGDILREKRGLATVFGTAIMAVGSIGWLAGRCLQAAVSREREFLADARAVQWTRSRDGLGGVLRKAMTQRADANRPSDPAWPIAVDHLLLLGHLAEHGGWLDSHPPLAVRIRRIYGRSMAPLPLVQDDTQPATPA